METGSVSVVLNNFVVFFFQELWTDQNKLPSRHFCPETVCALIVKRPSVMLHTLWFMLACLWKYRDHRSGQTSAWRRRTDVLTALTVTRGYHQNVWNLAGIVPLRLRSTSLSFGPPQVHISPNCTLTTRAQCPLIARGANASNPSVFIFVLPQPNRPLQKIK